MQHVSVPGGSLPPALPCLRQTRPEASRGHSPGDPTPAGNGAHQAEINPKQSDGWVMGGARFYLMETQIWEQLSLLATCLSNIRVLHFPLGASW